MITRIFHPVGQGAFYSERHNNFNIVYDCGTEWRNRANKTIDKTIKQSFSKNDIINILFISHFDYDHVSKIRVLKEHVEKIEKVVMPFLHKNEKYLLLNIYRALGFDMDILTLINNPQDFFGNDTQIITVTPPENNETPLGDNRELLDIDTLPTTSIKSGSILKKTFNTYEWIFIPYNYEYKNRNNQLKELLKEEKKEDFNIDELKNNPDYTLKITSEKRKILRKIYDELDGRINQNSMLLYSGLNKDYKKYLHRYYEISYFDYLHRCCETFYFDYLHRCYELFRHIRWHRMMREEYRVSCLYTGDTDLNIVKVKSIFSDFWESIGTIQIPHHGDLKSFDKEVLEDKYYWCPISVGEKNSYGHPSTKVIADILSQHSCPILVTENLTSSFIQHIRC